MATAKRKMELWRSRREKNIGQVDRTCMDDHHEAILSVETFAAVQNMKAKRSNVVLDETGKAKRKEKRFTSK